MPARVSGAAAKQGTRLLLLLGLACWPDSRLASWLKICSIMGVCPLVYIVGEEEGGLLVFPHRLRGFWCTGSK
jgi:hypothetical protein